MMDQHRHHQGRHHLPLEVAANSVQIVLIAAMTTLVGVTCPLQTAKSAPEPLMPVPLPRRAMVMHLLQCRLLQRRRRHHRHRRSPLRHCRHPRSRRYTATRTQHQHSCVQAEMHALIVAAMLALAHEMGTMEVETLPVVRSACPDCLVRHWGMYQPYRLELWTCNPQSGLFARN